MGTYGTSCSLLSPRDTPGRGSEDQVLIGKPSVSGGPQTAATWVRRRLSTRWVTYVCKDRRRAAAGDSQGGREELGRRSKATMRSTGSHARTEPRRGTGPAVKLLEDGLSSEADTGTGCCLGQTAMGRGGLIPSSCERGTTVPQVTSLLLMSIFITYYVKSTALYIFMLSVI